MKRFIQTAIVVIVTAVAAAQQAAWVGNGYYAGASATQIVVSILWSLTLVTASVVLSGILNPKEER